VPVFDLANKMSDEQAFDSIDFIANKINTMYLENMKENMVSKISFQLFQGITTH